MKLCTVDLVAIKPVKRGDYFELSWLVPVKEELKLLA